MPFIDNTSPFLMVLDYSNRSTVEQANIDALIEYSSECIEKECNRTFGVTDYTELYDGDNQNNLVVDNPPINSLTSIIFHSYPGNASNPSGDVTIDGANFLYNSGSGEIKWDMFKSTTIDDVFGIFPYFGVFPMGFQNITVNYNGGFATVPKTIEFICAEAVIEVFSRPDAAFQMRSQKLGINSYMSFVDQVLFNKRKQLHKYKIRIVP